MGDKLLNSQLDGLFRLSNEITCNFLHQWCNDDDDGDGDGGGAKVSRKTKYDRLHMYNVQALAPVSSWSVFKIWGSSFDFDFEFPFPCFAIVEFWMLVLEKSERVEERKKDATEGERKRKSGFI